MMQDPRISRGSFIYLLPSSMHTPNLQEVLWLGHIMKPNKHKSNCIHIHQTSPDITRHTGNLILYNNNIIYIYIHIHITYIYIFIYIHIYIHSSRCIFPWMFFKQLRSSNITDGTPHPGAHHVCLCRRVDGRPPRAMAG
jgi:hypothetical protein